jgi:glycosyltransferase involved in cell wall biosynthesis
MNALVSVIIPTFNREQYIRPAVESVLAQTYPHVEVLVIDDGSTDSTREIIRSIDDSRVRYIYTANQGNYFARNTGLKEAKGEFIAFLDSDDKFLPQKLSKQLEKFDQIPGLGLCCGNVYVRHQDIPGKVFEDAAHSFSYDFETRDGFIERAVESNFIVTSTVVIRRECVKTLGYFNTEYQNAMDYEFFLRIVFNYPAVYMKDKFVERSIHPLCVSKNSINTCKALVYIFTDCSIKFEEGKIFKPTHKQLIRSAQQKSMYLLGLEYLLKYKYDDAYHCFKESVYQRKPIFRMLAMFVARFHISFLVALISSYRNFCNFHSLHHNPSRG